MASNNPMVPTPSTPNGMSQEEALYRGVALCQLNILKQQMQLGKLNLASRTVRLDNGVVISCNICFNREDVRVYVPPVLTSESVEVVEEINRGFMVHPRSSNYPTGANFSKPLEGGGYEKLPTEITHERSDGSTCETPITTMFPLYDNDFGTMVIYGDSEEFESAIAKPDNYGVNHWIAEYGVVGWRGWPAITLGCSRETSVEGVTQLDVQTSYNTYYTPLSGNIYVDGEAIPVPGKVRGAAFSVHGTVFVSTVNYTQYDFVGMADNTVNPYGQDWLYDNNATSIPDDLKPGKVGGYYDELYVKVPAGVPYLVDGRTRYATSGATNQDGASVDGWLRIGYRISPITNLPVWFSADGKQAIEDGGTWSWSYTATPNSDKLQPQGVFTSSFSSRSDSAHEYTVHNPPWGVLADTGWQAMYMLTKHGAVSYSRNDKTENSFVTHDDGDEYGAVPVYNQSRPDPVGQYITWSATATPNVYIASLANPKAGPVTWSGVDFVDANGIATVDVSSKCGVFTITATDNCGMTASRQCMGALGRWVYSQCVDVIKPDWSIISCYPPYGDHYVCPVPSPCSGLFGSEYMEDVNALQAAAVATGTPSYTVHWYATSASGPALCGSECVWSVGSVTRYQVVNWECV